MKEIGDSFKEKRKEMGITIEEAGTDLKIDSVLLENLEEGNDKVFSDILEVKKIIKLYAKYLGLDEEILLDSYNEYLFSKTSRISVADIKEGIERTKIENKKEVRSPYTIGQQDDLKTVNTVIIIVLLILVLLILYFILRRFIMG